MLYHQMGRTGLVVSRVGFGGIPILHRPEKPAIELLRRAVERGMNHVDTHLGYGDSEVKIGKALAGMREEVIVSTKIDKHNWSGARESLKKSLRRLRTKRIEMMYIKNVDSIEVMEQAMKGKSSLAVLREAQKAGVAGHIGFSSHTEKIAFKALRTGEFEFIMFPYNIVNREAEKRILPYCMKHGIGFICMKPLAGGLLTVPSSLFARMTRGRANTTASAAIRFCMAHEGVTSVIPGLAVMRHLDEAMAAEAEGPMSEAERRAAVARVVKVEKGFCRNCGYCKPCPQKIDIPRIFRFVHHYRDFDLKDHARRQYRRMDVDATKCAECGACLPKCPYKIDIPRKLKEAHRMLRG
jgi:uncharacterized protein